MGPTDSTAELPAVERPDRGANSGADIHTNQRAYIAAVSLTDRRTNSDAYDGANGCAYVAAVFEHAFFERAHVAAVEAQAVQPACQQRRPAAGAAAAHQLVSGWLGAAGWLVL